MNKKVHLINNCLGLFDVNGEKRPTNKLTKKKALIKYKMFNIKFVSKLNRKTQSFLKSNKSKDKSKLNIKTKKETCKIHLPNFHFKPKNS